MSAKSGGSFAALLMSGPLAAIPLMAMFGVPQFTAVTASTDHEPDGVLRQPQRVATEQTVSPDFRSMDEPQAVSPLAQQPAFSSTDTQPPRTPRPIALRGFSVATNDSRPIDPAAQQTPPRTAFDHTPATPPAVTSLASESAPARMRPKPTTLTTVPVPTSNDATWQNAAQKLQELGIDDYRLERGRGGDTFLFICQFSPGTDARIVRRFEAEAAEPFDAVQQVLQQLDNWLQLASSH